MKQYKKIIYKKHETFNDLCKIVVDVLVENKIVGWFQGKSEFGPRALGNRSILANPIYDNKQYLNDEVKYREYWRPYAPMILEKELKNWFELPKTSSPYMLFNAKIIPSKIGKIPSVTHEDNTARIQTVNSQINHKAFVLLSHFFERTNVPILLNTSFNLAGEPIVESPIDAINTFKNSNIDYLVMENYFLSKE